MFLPHQLPQRFRCQHFNIRTVFQDVHEQLAVIGIRQFQDVAPGVIKVALLFRVLLLGSHPARAKHRRLLIGIRMLAVPFSMADSTTATGLKMVSSIQTRFRSSVTARPPLMLFCGRDEPSASNSRRRPTNHSWRYQRRAVAPRTHAGAARGRRPTPLPAHTGSTLRSGRSP